MKHVVMMLLVACHHGASSTRPDAPAGEGDAAPPDAYDPACAGVTCDQPPAPACVPGHVLATYDDPGTCTAGTCSYAEHDRTCAGACANARCTGAWSGFPEQDQPYARFGHSAVWTGAEMIVWGGAAISTSSYGDGAAYNPATGKWRAISSTDAPSARRDHSAVWTGTEMIVWGGSDFSQSDGLSDGGRYDPATDMWMPIPATDALYGRFGHSAVWTGTKMIVWGGGLDSTTSVSDGATFDPATGAWKAISTTGAPDPRRDHSAVWTGSEMLVFGGSPIYAGGGTFPGVTAYDPTTDTWADLPTTNAPTSRFSQSAVWTGSELLMFGGALDSTTTLDDGARLDPATGAWSALPASGRPTLRREHSAVWTGSAMLVWGGSTIVDGGTVDDDGGTFAVFLP